MIMSTADKLAEILKSEVTDFLKNQGHTGAAAQKEFSDFYATIEPDILQQLSTGNIDNINILRDRLVIKAASIGLGIVQQERKAVAAIVIAVLKTAIALA